MTDYVSYQNELHRVTSFTIVGDYVITVTFDDNTERTIDFEPILAGPIFGPLRDHYLFSQVRLDPNFGALEWPNGADIDPTVLYDLPQHVEVIVEQRKSLVAEPV